MNLQVFKFTYEAGLYSDGVALVAAKNRNNAQLLLDNDWKFDSLVENLVFNGEEKVIEKLFYIE